MSELSELDKLVIVKAIETNTKLEKEGRSGNLTHEEEQTKQAFIELISSSGDSKKQKLAEYAKELSSSAPSSVRTTTSVDEGDIGVICVLLYGLSVCGIIIMGIIGLATDYEEEDNPNNQKFGIASTVLFLSCVISGCCLCCQHYAEQNK
eukprot:15916_1